MTIKYALGKLVLPEGSHVLWRKMATCDSDSILPLGPDHLARLASLPMHHRDPFDRIMIAQALEEGWEVISSDD